MKKKLEQVDNIKKNTVSHNGNKIRLSGPLMKDSIVDGDGLRAVLWTQGCHRHCPGCHNPETWPFDCGMLVETAWVCEELKKIKGQNGLTLTGGEPFEQAEALLKIVQFCKQELGWNIWAWSGYTYEELKAIGGAKWELVQAIDVLVDGPFVIAEKDFKVKFRGSRNQRILYLSDGKIIKQE